MSRLRTTAALAAITFATMAPAALLTSSASASTTAHLVRPAVSMGLARRATVATTSAARSDATTTVPEPAPGAFGAVPRPNSGTKPQASGDRGGSAQLALLGVITAGLAVIGIVIARSTKRHTQSRSID